MIGAAGREEFGELRPHNRTVLRAGMVNSIEPGCTSQDSAASATRMSCWCAMARLTA
jgi:Xaa-Pro aminopeptidase